MKRFGLALIACFVGVIVLSVNSKAQEPEKFHGLYGGFFSGYAGVDEDFNDTLGPDSFHLDGWINGLAAGYSFKHDRILLGVEVDGAILEAQDQQTCPGGGFCSIDLSWLLTARGRLGYIFGDEHAYALYVTGGYAVLGVGVNSTLAPGGPHRYRETGYVIGGGGEAYLLDTNWISTKVEYLYLDFGDGKTYATGTATSANLKLDMHLLKVGLNIHF